MNRQIPYLAAIVLAGGIVAGCSDGNGNGNNGGGNNPPPPPPPPATTSFTDFVHAQLTATSDTSDPVDVNGIDFTFPDDDNPNAFNDVLGITTNQ